jgi:hypothetical protein
VTSLQARGGLSQGSPTTSIRRNPLPPSCPIGRGDKKKKKIKKVVYYEIDSLSPSTSGFESLTITSKRHERKKYSKMPLRYPLFQSMLHYSSYP